MRRRRQKNPLLMRIIAISVGVHLVALPILAHFGAFKKIQEHFVQAQMVVLPPPQTEKVNEEVRQKQVARKTPGAKKSASSSQHAHVASHHANPNAPHVAVAQGNGPGGDGDGVEQGNGKQGVLPAPPPTTNNGTAKNDTGPAPPDKNATAPQTQTTQPVVKNTAPPTLPPKVDTPPVKPVVPEKPKEPVYTEAAPIDSNQPKPDIPDDLRSEALDKTFVAEVRVSPEGKPMDVQVSQSTGNDELDRAALDAARKWRFKPATRDGQPIESKIRLHIEFQVD